MELPREMVDAILACSDSISPPYTNSQGEVIAVYWLGIVAAQSGQGAGLAFSSSLITTLTLRESSSWYRNEERMREQLENLRRSATLAKRGAYMNKLDLVRGMSDHDKLIAIVAKASAHYARVGDTNEIAIDTVIRALNRLDGIAADDVRRFCAQLPRGSIVHASRQSSSGCLILIVAVALWVAFLGGVLHNFV